MKRIKINDKLVQSVKKFNDELFNTKRKDFKKPIIKLKELKESYNNKQDLFTSYICLIEKNYSTLLNLKPSEFKKWIVRFENILDIKSLPNFDSKKQNDKKILKSLCSKYQCEEKELKGFADKIIAALRYDDYRDSEYPKVINDLGWNIKTCFYCNYVGTLTVLKGNKYKTYYDLDHILPKSIYPFLATTFFNFIPCCSSCNRTKSNQVIPYLNPFYQCMGIGINVNTVFEIAKKSKTQFYTNFDKRQIKIVVSDKINNIKKEDYDKIVNLELLYNTQKHEAEEILWKKKVYEDTYIKSIQSSFAKLDLKKHEINRILWGTDLDEDNINDRPLGKFKLDLINGD